MQQYDVVIIGAGPAGLTAGLYASRSKLSTLYIEELATGGQAAATDEIENYPGFVHGVSGPDLSDKMEEQAKRFGAVKLAAKVDSLQIEGNYRVIKTNKGDFKAKTVIIASGAAPKLLGCSGELEFRARGVSYCATCDAAFYEGVPNVMVVGGGDSAVEEANYLTKFAEKVTLVHRRDSFRATKVVQDKAFNNPKLNIVWNTVVEEITGDGIVEQARLKNIVTGETTEMAIDGIFIYVGLVPNTDFLGDLITTKNGYIVTDADMRTNIPGVYAAGDVRDKLLRQVVIAAADGAIAAFVAEKYIEEHHEHF